MASTTNTGYYTPSNSTYTIATGGTGGIGLATTVVYGGGGSVATGQVLGQPLTGHIIRSCLEAIQSLISQPTFHIFQSLTSRMKRSQRR
jgi:hypothetical protein